MPTTSSRPSLDTYFLAMLPMVGLRSTCVRRQVAAIVTDNKGRVLSMGYNGVPSGLPHCTDSPCIGAKDHSGDTSRCDAVHAEANSLLQCTRLDLAYTLYCSCTPCFECAKLIANTPIRRVVSAARYTDLAGESVLLRSGIVVVYASS